MRGCEDNSRRRGGDRKEKCERCHHKCGRRISSFINDIKKLLSFYRREHKNSRPGSNSKQVSFKSVALYLTGRSASMESSGAFKCWIENQMTPLSGNVHLSTGVPLVRKTTEPLDLCKADFHAVRLPLKATCLTWQGIRAGEELRGSWRVEEKQGLGARHVW